MNCSAPRLAGLCPLARLVWVVALLGLVGSPWLSAAAVAGAVRSDYPPFDSNQDLLLAQFDGRPDADDVQAQAALGCLLRHPDLAGVKRYGVMNAYGRQAKTSKIWNSTSLMDLAFGVSPHGEFWTNADKPKEEGGNGTGDWQQSVVRVKNQVKSALQRGGRVWVQEAGQSDLTAQWLAALLADGVPAAAIKERVNIVQHSDWNENKTTPSDLETVKRLTRYIKISSGNYAPGDPKDPLNNTPGYKTTTAQLAAHAALRVQAKTAANPNHGTRTLWTEGDRIIADWSAPYSTIGKGGLDFSDCVANWWILGLEDKADSIEKFWARYVVSAPATAP